MAWEARAKGGVSARAAVSASQQALDLLVCAPYVRTPRLTAHILRPQRTFLASAFTLRALASAVAAFLSALAALFALAILIGLLCVVCEPWKGWHRTL